MGRSNNIKTNLDQPQAPLLIMASIEHQQHQPNTQALYDRLNLTPTELQQLCQHWQIQEFALFGSILRPDFRPDSDIDILLIFQPQATWTLFDIVHLQQDLEHRTGRKIDLAEKQQLLNPYRRIEILKTHRILYVSP